jgi:Ca-activated chloride channel family protein
MKRRVISSIVVVLVTWVMVFLGAKFTRDNYELARPQILWLLLALVVYGVWYILWGTRTAASFTFSAPAKKWTGQRIQLSRHLLFLLRATALAGLIITAAQPQSSSNYEDLTREGINIMLSMDVSGSMLSKDFEPNRLESAKSVAIQFVDSRADDRLGVVVYEGEAMTQVPLTTDHRVVKNSLAEIKTGNLQPGTAIGSGLATAINRLREAEGTSNVVILMTDGMSNAGQIDPMDAAQLAALYGIRVYTIGVGTIGKAKSPVGIMNGQYVYDWVEVEIDEDLLHNIADYTGGKYFRATSRNKLESIYAEIDQLEKTRFNVLQYNRKKEEYLPFLLVALALLLLEFLLRHTFFRSAL